VRMRRLVFSALLLLVPACVPADGAFGLGSVQFTIKGSRASEFGFRTNDGWDVKADRVILGFRTMTIGKVGDDDRCAFRGRGEKSDIVFDPRLTIVQTFNGISEANCEDTGIFLSPPGDTTELGPGATAADLFDLAQGDPAHALVDLTATNLANETFVLRFRFDTLRTSSRFGGCAGRFEAKGVRVRVGERTLASTTFAPENMLQNSLGFGGSLRLAPFKDADESGNNDGVFTMNEADDLQLRSVRLRYGDGYQLPNGTSTGSFGDFLRALFRFTFFFKEVGTCVGNEPGTENE
jgi:hypothetical protein